MLEIYKPVSNKDSIYFDEPVGSLKDLFQDIGTTMNTNSSIQFIQPYLSVTEASAISRHYQRKTDRTSKVLEMRLFDMLGVTFVFAKMEVFHEFFNVRVKSIRGVALKLSQPSCLPHDG